MKYYPAVETTGRGTCPRCGMPDAALYRIQGQPEFGKFCLWCQKHVAWEWHRQEREDNSPARQPASLQ